MGVLAIATPAMRIRRIANQSSGKPPDETCTLRPERRRKAWADRCRRNDPGPLRRGGGLPSRADDIRPDGPAVAARSGEAAGGQRQSPARLSGGAHRALHRHRAQLYRPRQGDRRGDPGRADHLLQGAELALRPGRRRDHSEGIAEARLGGGARLRHRQARLLCGRGRRARLRARLHHLQRRVGALLADRKHRAVDQGQERTRHSVRSGRGS